MDTEVTSADATMSRHDDRMALLEWGHTVRRDLPWRRTREPWAILLAEVMAQQTQVDRVVPKWLAFLERWPNPATFADASLAEVLDHWAGLGYPRRARDLWRAARRICDEHGGRVPADLQSLLALPGVGPYTARAVLAFAFELDAAVVDTNVGRVLARRAGARLTPSAAQAAADAWLPRGKAWEWNQTLLDLGALVCTPVSPACDRCPISARCSWVAADQPEPDPAVGSAGVSRRQARYEGSLRQLRGRLLEAARRGPVPSSQWPELASGASGENAAARAEQAVRSLVADGLAELDSEGRLILPGSDSVSRG